MTGLEQFIGVGSLLIAIAALVRSAGKTEGSFEGRIKALEDQGKVFLGYHAEHFQHAKDDQHHFQDTEMHWTTRERDGLALTLKRIEDKIDAAMAFVERRKAPRTEEFQ